MSFDPLQQLSLIIRCVRERGWSERRLRSWAKPPLPQPLQKGHPSRRAARRNPRALRIPRPGGDPDAPPPPQNADAAPPAEEAAAAAARNTMAAMASLRRFLSPAFYQAAATDFGAMVRTKYIQGNILAQPITGFMVTIGAVGYFIEYSVLGRYHVAHKKEKTAAAIKEYDAKHAHH